MAVRQNFIQYVYGVGDNLIQIPPQPIVANRDPSSSDFAQPGTVWINSSDDTIWMLATITANSANWQTSPASGIGIFTSVEVTTGDLDVDMGDVNILLGDLNVDAGNTTLAGDLTVSGTVTLNGDIDLSSAALIDLTSTLDAAPSILLEANGGTSEQVKIFSNQGTSVSSVYLLSDVGGLTLRATGLASADAINLEAPAGGIDMDAALQINITSTQNAGNAIVLNASAGAIDILATGGAGEDIDITNTLGSINVTGGEGAADAVKITASAVAGGIVITSGTGGNALSSTGSTTVDSVGGIEINSSAGSILVGNDAVAQAIGIGTGAAARTVTVGNATGATSVVVNVGTGALDLGTNATAHATAIGSTTATSTLTLNTPVGTNVLAAEGISVTTAGRGVSLPGGVLVLSGAGSPDTVVTAPIGSLYLNTTGSGVADRAFINTDGTTAWTAISTVA